MQLSVPSGLTQNFSGMDITNFFFSFSLEIIEAYCYF